MKMKPLALVRSSTPISSSPPPRAHSLQKPHLQNPRFRVSCSSAQPEQIKSERTEYKPGILDDLLLNSFRQRLVEEVGLDSEKPGYDGVIELANALMMKGKTNSDTRDAAVRIVMSFFPPLFLKLFRILIVPIADGKLAAAMIARVTVLTCQWLMGTCKVNSVDLPDGTSCPSGVFVERCKYLEESKCIGVCINTCKFPTQFKFGVLPPLPEDDTILKEPCLEICPTSRRREVARTFKTEQCPKA